jgi:hypothetical protein
MERCEFTINSQNVRSVMVHAWQLVSSAAKAGDLILILAKPDKTREQEKRYHSLLGEISKQVVFEEPGLRTRLRSPESKRYPPEVWKALLVDEFEQERALMGEPLRKPGRVVLSLDGHRMVSLRPSTRDFSRKEASDFIEFLYAWGSEMGVLWSARAHEILEAGRMAA